ATAKPMLEEPLSDTFRHRQTMANAVRFTTPKLAEIEGQIASAAERATALENELFAKLGQAIGAEETALSELAAALADLDCLAALAELADVENYTRPIVDDTATFVIRDGRHPVVEQALARDLAGPFIRNDCVLALPPPDLRDAYSQDRDEDDDGANYPPGFEQDDTGRIWLVTGPNMAGKSTFLRQNALITLMAQMGAFVPAGHAHIGIVDRLFSRVGASDDIASGRSTFMVEMVETAGILNAATERSFVILDEIGRGTSTFDGLSIAWATVEHLHDVNCCRALFATHYHELTTLSDRLGEVANVTVDVKEWKDEIVFLHKVRSGAADRSYGIHVARLAGLPDAVTRRAREILAILEEGKQASSSTSALEDLPLFAASLANADDPAQSTRSPLDQALDDINPDDLTPRAALDLIYQLKRIRLEDGG
ncbi:MAG: DNA mismatch repair protein MutS, partial [Hyphomicrobiaceae bacterium]